MRWGSRDALPCLASYSKSGFGDWWGAVDTAPGPAYLCGSSGPVSVTVITPHAKGPRATPSSPCLLMFSFHLLLEKRSRGKPYPSVSWGGTGVLEGPGVWWNPELAGASIGRLPARGFRFSNSESKSICDKNQCLPSSACLDPEAERLPWSLILGQILDCCRRGAEARGSVCGRGTISWPASGVLG